MVVQRNSERTKKVIQRLLQWYKKRTGIFSGTGLPETVLPEGVQPGSDEHIMFITMCSTLDYSRNADALWDAGRKTWADESTRWVFFPHQVEKKTFDDLKKDLHKYRLSQRWEKQDPGDWQRVSLSFLKLFDGSPRNMLEKFDFDALKISKYMKIKKLEKKDAFPILRGDKINSMWIRILHDEVGINFKKNYEKIHLPIDIHVMRATFTTGCLVGKYSGSFDSTKGMAINAWAEVCEDLSLNQLDLDEALFNLSREGCSNIKNGKCPKRNECELYPSFCVTANPRCKLEINDKELHIDTSYPSDKI